MIPSAITLSAVTSRMRSALRGADYSHARTADSILRVDATSPRSAPLLVVSERDTGPTDVSG
jgi:hypothetical protein